MRLRNVFVLACILAMYAPLVKMGEGKASPEAGDAFPGWPTRLGGLVLEPAPLAPIEAEHARSLPGRMARFRAGGRSIMMCWLVEPTRRLHPRELCLRGAGFTVEPQAGWTDETGIRWGVLQAERGETRLRVLERVWDDAGNGFPDPSAWYWAALLGRTRGPWWYVAVDEAAE